MVLLDEPLAGLDVAVATEVRHALAARLRGRTSLLVTHELLDIWTIADQVAVLEGGRVVESGPVADLLARPTSTFLGRLSGTNLFTGTALSDTVLQIAPGVNLHGLPDPGPAARRRALPGWPASSRQRSPCTSPIPAAAPATTWPQR